MRVIAHKLRSAGHMFPPYARSVKLIATADAGSRIPSEIDIIVLYLSVCVIAKRSAQPAISGDSHADNVRQSNLARQARRQEASRRGARSDERDHVYFEHGMPVACDPESSAAAQHTFRLSRLVELRRHA